MANSGLLFLSPDSVLPQDFLCLIEIHGVDATGAPLKCFASLPLCAFALNTCGPLPLCVNSPMAHVVEILIAESPAAPMAPQQVVRAVPGRGLAGDRYAQGIGTFSPQPPKPDHELTLVQQEHVEEFARDLGKPFSARDMRRNVVTRGIDLNSLVGHEFRVGAVLVRGIRLCEPCNFLAKQTTPEVLRGLVHKGGLRAQILSEGDIRVGDVVSIAVPDRSEPTANDQPAPKH